MKVFYYSLASFVLLFPSTVFARVNYYGQINDTGTAIYGSADAPEGNFFLIIGGLLNAILGLLGLVLFVMFIYGGFLWMTAGGNTEKVKQAKDILLNAIIGLIILVAAFAISTYVVSLLSQALVGGTSTQG